jgi:hypothetical protein
MSRSRRRSPPGDSTGVAKTDPLSTPPGGAQTPAIKRPQLTPVQFFQQRFTELEVHLHRLHQFHPPRGSQHFFELYQNFRGKLSVFSTHAAKLLKQRALSAALNIDSFHFFQAFRVNFSEFIQGIEEYHIKISGLSFLSIMHYFHKMEQSLEDISDACYHEPHARFIWEQH